MKGKNQVQHSHIRLEIFLPAPVCTGKRSQLFPCALIADPDDFLGAVKLQEANLP